MGHSITDKLKNMYEKHKNKKKKKGKSMNVQQVHSCKLRKNDSITLK